MRKLDGSPELDYNMVIPALFKHYYPEGLLGLGLTALLASFMSGMAGNVTAFNTIWTYDLYEHYVYPGASDRHYLWMGRAATVGGILLSIFAAYLAARFNNIMDVLQLVFAFVNAPLFATFLLGMFWKKNDWPRRLLGAFNRNPGRDHPPWPYCPARIYSRHQRRLDHEFSHLSKPDGAKLLDRDLRF